MRVFSAFTREWLEGDVAVAGGRIAGVGRYDGGERVEAGGRPVVPGMIDAHVHLESSKLLPSEFARVVVPRGTTAVVCDPHEVAERARRRRRRTGCSTPPATSRCACT